MCNIFGSSFFALNFILQFAYYAIEVKSSGCYQMQIISIHLFEIDNVCGMTSIMFYW